jgi:CubicO group peptidase (beta-lactamase class C family)
VLSSLGMDEGFARLAPSGDGGVAAVLAPIRERHGLPALAAALVLDGGVGPSAAVGVCKHGDATPARVSDRFHIGSCTKAMTATLAAMLIEEGRISWTTRLAEEFPEMAAVMRPEWQAVTVEHLLAHRAGFPGPEQSWPKGKSFLDMHDLPGDPREQRRAYVDLFLRQEPVGKPGERYVYSNAGYAVLGALLERVTDTPWEALITRRLFRPLGMTTAGFGAPGTPGKVDQPWGHRREARHVVPVESGRLSDNPPVIAPGGRVHCSLGDWAKFVAYHAREGQGTPPLLHPETVKRLHTPPLGGEYAAGWLVTERAWGGGKVLTHAGSNTMNFAVAWVAPLKRFAVLIATNIGGDEAAKACDEAAAGLIGRFLTR